MENKAQVKLPLTVGMLGDFFGADVFFFPVGWWPWDGDLVKICYLFFLSKDDYLLPIGSGIWKNSPRFFYNWSTGQTLEFPKTKQTSGTVRFGFFCVVAQQVSYGPSLLFSNCFLAQFHGYTP